MVTKVLYFSTIC